MVPLTVGTLKEQGHCMGGDCAWEARAPNRIAMAATHVSATVRGHDGQKGRCRGRGGLRPARRSAWVLAGRRRGTRSAFRHRDGGMGDTATDAIKTMWPLK